MKIKSLKLENIGPYKGINTMTFDLNDNRNIVLFGGKNGTGKTTIFSAIKVGLYGCKSFGYESLNSKYYEEISKLINTDIKTKQNKIASITIDALLEDGKQNNIFTINRCWLIKGSGIKENCQVYKNNELINGEELQNFIAYLDGVVSADLFNFFFFDGEKIGDYFLSSNSNQNFRKAFLSLCGLDSISLMVENFERVYKSSNQDSKVSILYYNVKDDVKKLQDEFITTEQIIKSLESDLITLEDQKEAIEQSYTISGGLTINAWKEINRKLLEEESFREAHYKQLRDIALSNLPFIIVMKRIDALQKQLQIESDIHKANILRSTLSDEKVIDFIVEYYNCTRIKANTFVKRFFSLLTPQNKNEEYKELLDLSSEDEQKINLIISNKKEFKVQLITDLFKEIDKSSARTNKARKKLKVSNIDKIEDFVKEMSEHNQLLLKTKSELDKMTNKQNSLRELLDSKEKEYEKVQKEFELELKNSSINNIAGRALLVYRETEESLVKEYAKKLEERFIVNFAKIINKKDFIDGINVDSKLNVRPYKKVVFSTSELKQLFNNYGKDYLINDIGVIDEIVLENALSSKEKVVELPVIIKSPLSQGEKQVYIMSLYISLLQIANVNVPFVIDTPFARIDSEHRGKIIEVFFKKLNSQVFILSTDEEIVNDFKKQLDINIANTFLLKSSSHGDSVIEKDCYFGDEI